LKIKKNAGDNKWKNKRLLEGKRRGAERKKEKDGTTKISSGGG